MRRAFTVVEIIVSVAIASLVIVMAWGFFTREQNRFRSDQSRLSGLQGAMQMDEALAWDLERIALGIPGVVAAFTIEEPVIIPTTGRQLDFRIFSHDPPRAVFVPTRQVTYGLDERTGRVVRIQDGVQRVFGGLVAEDVQFSLIKLPPRPRPGLFTFYAEQPVHAVKYIVTCFSEGQRSMPDAHKKDQDRVTLVGAVAIPFRADRLHHPYWRCGFSDFLEPVR